MGIKLRQMAISKGKSCAMLATYCGQARPSAAYGTPTVGPMRDMDATMGALGATMSAKAATMIAKAATMIARAATICAQGATMSAKRRTLRKP